MYNKRFYISGFTNDGKINNRKEELFLKKVKIFNFEDI